jgi:magnesium transporter
MNTIFVHRDGRTEQVTSIDRSWLSPASGAYIWVDLAAPSIPESLVLTDTFAFHRLAVDDAMTLSPTPKIDAYDGYLFAAMAGTDADVGFFVGAHHMVSVHWSDSKAVADGIDSVRHGGKQFSEGPFAMFHRLVDAMTGGFTPAVHALGASAASSETRLLEKPTAATVRDAVDARSAAFALIQRLSKQAEAVGRLAARDIVAVSDEMSIRFRHVRHQLVRLADEALVIDRRLGDVLTAAGAARGRRWI